MDDNVKTDDLETENQEPMDPFDPAALRLDPSFEDGGPTSTKLLLTIPVRKPSKHEWVRVNPDSVR